MQETLNGLFDAEALFGAWCREIRESLRNLEKVPQKIDFIQEQLVVLLRICSSVNMWVFLPKRWRRSSAFKGFTVNGLKACDTTF